MKNFRIESKAGVEMGVWSANTRAEALFAMHREAGYDVTLIDDELLFKGDTDEALCGGLDCWYVTEVSE